MLLVGALFVLTACSTKPNATNNSIVQPASSTTPSLIQTAIVPGSLKDFQVNVGDTVHFDYDRSNVLDEDKTTLQRQAVWLNKYPSVRVTIQGNCDERGTRAYNLALGAQRAEAVKEYLVSLGVSSARMGTISYGKERPVCAESNEACWAQNRRAVTGISSGAAS